MARRDSDRRWRERNPEAARAKDKARYARHRTRKLQRLKELANERTAQVLKWRRGEL